MECHFDPSLAKRYHSRSQCIRILTESWVQAHMYCPRCGHAELNHCPNNQAVADFYCPQCGNEYELKSKSGLPGHKIADGAYETFIQRITSDRNPDFFILSYDPDALCVTHFWIVPKHFFVPRIVEKRKPLGTNAKRAGWVGCNILFDEIPIQGRITVIQNGMEVSRDTVLNQVRAADRLYTEGLQARGWLMDVLQCINQIQANIFTLDQVYAFEPVLAERHRSNQHIRPKIRQQLQLLRDRGFLSFLGSGVYKKAIPGGGG